MELSEKQLRDALKTAWCAGFSAPIELDGQHAPAYMDRDVDNIIDGVNAAKSYEQTKSAENH